VGGGAGAAAGRVSLTVRRATAADLDAILTIENGAFPDPWSRRSFASLLDAPTVRMDVLVDAEGAVLGYVVLLCAPPDADVANIAVSPRARRQGAGRRLLGTALGAAARAGVRTVHLEVRESNVAARALYAAFGFAPVGRRRGYYQQPREDALVLRATLSDPRE
jgi:[ribosomal protein S18]-alanine N-acetyltransferase